MGKADDIRAAREAAFKSSHGSPANPDQDVARQHEHRSGALTGVRPRGEGAPVANPAHVKPKGRPLDKDRAKSFEATKPWLAEGMSRRTWYRRQAEKRAK